MAGEKVCSAGGLQQTAVPGNEGIRVEKPDLSLLCELFLLRELRNYHRFFFFLESEIDMRGSEKVDFDGAERKRILLGWLFAKEESDGMAIVILGTVHLSLYFFFFSAAARWN